MSAALLALLLAAPPGPQARPAFTPGWAGSPESGIFYETTGKGPDLIFIHGGQMDRRIWNPQIVPFAERFRVIRYDVRGYGSSPAPRAPYSDVQDLLAVMEAAKVEQAHIVGLSLGGRIAIDFALAHPDRVLTLSLSGPGLSGWPWQQSFDAATLRLKEAIKAKDGKRIVEAWLQHDSMRPAMGIPALAPTLRRMVEENVPAWTIDESLNRDHALRALDHLQELRTPTFLIVGDQDLPEIQMICRRVASLARLARRMVLPQAGHILNMEKPEEFNRAVLSFIDSVGDLAGEKPPAPPARPR